CRGTNARLVRSDVLRKKNRRAPDLQSGSPGEVDGDEKKVAQASRLWGGQASCLSTEIGEKINGQDARWPHRQDACATAPSSRGRTSRAGCRTTQRRRCISSGRTWRRRGLWPVRARRDARSHRRNKSRAAKN